MQPRRTPWSGSSTIWPRVVGTRHIGIGLDYVYDLELETLPEGTDPAYWFPPEFGYDEGFYKSLDFVSPEAAGGLSARLAARGYDADEIAAIMGGNFLRVAEQCWGRQQQKGAG